MPRNVALTDEAVAVLDAYAFNESIPGSQVLKGQAASQAVIRDLMPKIPEPLVSVLLTHYPTLAKFTRSRKS